MTPEKIEANERQGHDPDLFNRTDRDRAARPALWGHGSVARDFGAGCPRRSTDDGNSHHPGSSPPDERHRHYRGAGTSRWVGLTDGAEVIAGSTRIKAGTAQQAVLNMLSTTLMIKLGHGYHGQMVEMRVVNAKLGKRAARIVHDLAGGTSAEIEAALLTSHQNVKRAILIRSGLTAEDAETALAQHAGDLRAVMATRTDQG